MVKLPEKYCNLLVQDSGNKATIKLSKYKHLGKTGSKAYNDSIVAVTRRAKIDALERMKNSLKQGWIDLYEEKERAENRTNS